MPFGAPGPYPIPALDGPQYLKYHRFQPSYAEVTDEHTYEDGGASFVLRNDTAPIIFLFEYDGLLDDEAALLDGHRADAFGNAFGFDFTDPRTEDVFEDVHYLEWEEDHLLIATVNKRVVRLIKRP